MTVYAATRGTAYLLLPTHHSLCAIHLLPEPLVAEGFAAGQRKKDASLVTVRSCLKVALRERRARSRLQVFLERDRARLVAKLHDHIEVGGRPSAACAQHPAPCAPSRAATADVRPV